jgi:hypothetical protein
VVIVATVVAAAAEGGELPGLVSSILRCPLDNRRPVVRKTIIGRLAKRVKRPHQRGSRKDCHHRGRKGLSLSSSCYYCYRSETTPSLPAAAVGRARKYSYTGDKHALRLFLTVSHPLMDKRDGGRPRPLLLVDFTTIRTSLLAPSHCREAEARRLSAGSLTSATDNDVTVGRPHSLTGTKSARNVPRHFASILLSSSTVPAVHSRTATHHRHSDDTKPGFYIWRSVCPEAPYRCKVYGG